MNKRRKMPDGWRWVNIGDVASVQSGYAFKSEWFSPDGIRLLRNANIFQGNISWEETVYLPCNQRNKYSDYELRKGDIVLALDRPLVSNGLKVSQLTSNDVPSLLLQRVGRFILNCDSIIPEYLFAFLNSSLFINAITGHDYSLGVPHISPRQVQSVGMPLPPIEEQRRIVAVLDEKLAAVAQAHQAAQAQLEAAQALPAAYLRAIFDSPKAQSWPRHRLGDIIQIDAPIVDPTLPEYKSLPHVSGENMESGTGRLLYLNSAEEDGMTSGKYLFDAGVVLYSKLRPYLQKVTLANFRGLCSADMYPVKVNPDVITADFLLWLLLSNEFTGYANEESQRSRMPKLNRQQLFSFEAAIPPLKMQKEIAFHLSSKMVESEKVKIQIRKQIDLIYKLPASYLQQAFNG